MAPINCKFVLRGRQNPANLRPKRNRGERQGVSHPWTALSDSWPCKVVDERIDSPWRREAGWDVAAVDKRHGGLTLNRSPGVRNSGISGAFCFSNLRLLSNSSESRSLHDEVRGSFAWENQAPHHNEFFALLSRSIGSWRFVAYVGQPLLSLTIRP